MNSRIFIAALWLITAATACTPQENREKEVFLYTNSLDIQYGNDICAFAGKPIEKVRYGGRIAMKNGEIYKFMSAECTAGFYLGLKDREEVAKIEIVDFAHGQKYLPAEELKYLQSPLQPSPNGMYLTPVDASNKKMLSYIYDAYPGTYLEWDEVLDLISKEWDIRHGYAGEAQLRNR